MTHPRGVKHSVKRPGLARWGSEKLEHVALTSDILKGEQKVDKVAAPVKVCDTSGQHKKDIIVLSLRLDAIIIF